MTVIRDGRHIETRPADELSHGGDHPADGRALARRSSSRRRRSEIGRRVFRAEGLSRGGLFSDVSFELRRGEIVGLAGFVGAGRTEVARAIFGVDPLDAGRLWIEDRSFRPRSPRAALRRGLAYLPEDRIHQGLIQPMSIAQNATLAVLPS